MQTTIYKNSRLYCYPADCDTVFLNRSGHAVPVIIAVRNGCLYGIDSPIIVLTDKTISDSTPADIAALRQALSAYSEKYAILINSEVHCVAPGVPELQQELGSGRFVDNAGLEKSLADWLAACELMFLDFPNANEIPDQITDQYFWLAK